MPGYLPIEQPILFGNAAADVVDDEIAFITIIPVVRDNADVGHALTVEVPGHDIAGLIVRAVRGNSDGFAFTRKEGLQIGYASMIDVRVRGFQSPFLRISRKVRGHVFVNFFLQVDPGLAKSSNDNVRTCAGIGRHVAAGIRNHAIVLCVMGRCRDLFSCALENAADRFGRYVVGRRPLKRLNRSVRTERMVERRFAAAATETND